MDLIFIILFLTIFATITWKNFSHGLFLLFLLLPTYLIRFSIGPLPSTFLEGIILITILIYSIKNRTTLITDIKSLFHNNTLLFSGILLFLLGATISIAFATDIRAALGEWKAFYIEPVLLFLVLSLAYKKKQITTLRPLFFALILSGFVTSLLAIYQHYTGWLVPHAFWANRDTYRVTAWYGFPNGVGLFLGPIVMVAVYLVKQWFSERSNKYLLILPILAIPTTLLAILYAKSTGALVGIAGAIGLLLLLHKKTRLPAIIVGIIGLYSLLSFSALSPLKEEVFFQDRSGQIRLSMWQDTWNLLQDHPIRGAGLASYTEVIEPYHTRVNREGIEIFHHPHNIFLTLWVNTGIIGLFGFLLIICWFYYTGFRDKKYYQLAIMTSILVMGLVDSPYIKNDLAIFFWLFPAALLAKTTK